MAAAEGEAFLYGVQYAIENQTPFLCISAGGGMRMMESLISLSQMTRTTVAIIANLPSRYLAQFQSLQMML